MSLFLMTSLTEEAIARLHPYRNEYTINNKICAPLLYKVIMRQATIASKATSEALRQNLNELASYACPEPEDALKMMDRHKTKGMCRLSPDGNYELILEWKMRVCPRFSKQECSKQCCYIH